MTEEEKIKKEYERNKCNNMSEEKKDKKREYARNRYHTLSLSISLYNHFKHYIFNKNYLK